MANIINSDTDISNMAMSHLGQSPVNSITNPESKAEHLLALWYDQSKRELLEMFDWNFAVKRMVLTKLSESPAFGYEAQFALPEDYISLLTVGETEYDWDKNYTIEGNNLLSRTLSGSLYSSEINGLPVRIIRNINNVAAMTPTFKQALSLRIAGNTCFAITNSSSRLDQINRDFMITMKLAKYADAKSSPVKRVNRFRSYLDRQGSGSRLHGSRYGNKLWHE